MSCELVLCAYERTIILQQHDFFVQQLSERVLSQFEDIASEADAKAAQCLDGLVDETRKTGAKHGNIYEIAHAEGLELYESLWEMKRQMTLSAFALLYHQWDKGLRTFLEREFLHFYCQDDVEKAVWHPNVDQLLSKLEVLGWSAVGAEWFKQIMTARLIVNVFKHGKGRALNELFKSHPHYVLGPFKDFQDELGKWPVAGEDRFEPNHEHLEVSKGELMQLAAAIRRFWEEIPESTQVPAEF